MFVKPAIQSEAILDDSLWFYSLYGVLFPEWEKPKRKEPTYHRGEVRSAYSSG